MIPRLTCCATPRLDGVVSKHLSSRRVRGHELRHGPLRVAVLRLAAVDGLRLRHVVMLPGQAHALALGDGRERERRRKVVVLDEDIVNW